MDQDDPVGPIQEAGSADQIHEVDDVYIGMDAAGWWKPWIASAMMTVISTGLSS